MPHKFGKLQVSNGSMKTIAEMRVGLKDLFNKKIGPKKASIPLLGDSLDKDKCVCSIDTTIHVIPPEIKQIPQH